MKQPSNLFPELAAEVQSGSSQVAMRSRKRYVPPMLVAHGRFERVTLQASGGNELTGGDGGTLNN